MTRDRIPGRQKKFYRIRISLQAYIFREPDDVCLLFKKGKKKAPLKGRRAGDLLRSLPEYYEKNLICVITFICYHG